MSERAERLKKSWKSRTSDSLQKARSAINQLIASEEEVTFAAVHKVSGVSKNFLYNNAEIRKEIENARKDTHEIAEIKRQKNLKQSSRGMWSWKQKIDESKNLKKRIAD